MLVPWYLAIHFLYSTFAIIFNKLFFLEKFQIHNKIEWKVTESSRIALAPLSQPHVPHISGLQQGGTFVIINEATVTRYYHPKSIVYIRAHSCVAHSICFSKCIRTAVHHYNIIQKSHCSKFFSAVPNQPSQPLLLAITDHFTVFYCIHAFSRVSRNLESHRTQPFSA